MKVLFISSLLVAAGLFFSWPSPQKAATEYPKCDKTIPPPPELYECPDGGYPNAKCVRMADEYFRDTMKWAVVFYCTTFESAWKDYIDGVNDCMEYYDFCITYRPEAECKAEADECLERKLSYLSHWLDVANEKYDRKLKEAEEVWHELYAICCH